MMIAGFLEGVCSYTNTIASISKNYKVLNSPIL